MTLKLNETRFDYDNNELCFDETVESESLIVKIRSSMFYW